MPIKDLTDFHIEGEIWCPDGGEFVQFDGSWAELQKFIAEHACDEETGND